MKLENKICLSVLFLILAGSSANAQSAANEVGDKNDHFLSFGFSLGLLSGTSEEIIYRSSSDDNYLSQLVWQFNPLFYAGVDVRYNWLGPANPEGILRKVFSGFFVNASFKYGLPGYTGLMEDRDWWTIPDWLTHYSLHANYTETAMLAGLDIGKSFRLYNEFRLNAFFSYSVMYYSFTARGGTYLYPLEWGEHFYDPSSDTVVTYLQFWQILSPGVSFYGVFNNYFDIEIFAKVSPLVTASSLDEHLWREPPFQIVNDPMYYGLYIEPGLAFTFKPPQSKFLFSFSLNYRNISGTRGNSRYRYQDRSGVYGNVGGAAYTVFDIGLAVKFRPL
jgi:outer membrane protease